MAPTPSPPSTPPPQPPWTQTWGPSLVGAAVVVVCLLITNHTNGSAAVVERLQKMSEIQSAQLQKADELCNRLAVVEKFKEQASGDIKKLEVDMARVKQVLKLD